MGMLSDGKVRCVVMNDTKRSSIHPIVRSNVKDGSFIVTDEWFGYDGLEDSYHREVVDHRSGQYLNANGFTTNSIEGFWGILKRGLIGIYNWVSRKHLQKYCEEFVFRYNYRNLKPPQKFMKALSNYALARLPYKQLIV
jgi:transposase-like protein